MVGREREISFINGLLPQRKNILLYGEKGVGKTAIVRYILGGEPEGRHLYVQDNETLRCTLLGILSGKTQSALTGASVLNILALKKKCYSVLDTVSDYMILDHMGRVEPKQYAFLTYLLERGIPLLIVARGFDKKSIGHLRMALHNFEKIEVMNLDRPASNRLVEECITEYGIAGAGGAGFKQAIFHYSGGNPGIIKALCLLARDDKYRKRDAIDVGLIDLDRRISEVVQ